MTAAVPPKSLKDQIRWQLWLTIAANIALFYVACQADALVTFGIKGVITGATNLLPVALAFIITSVANGLLDAAMKARLVFFRWNHALPGHRAFTRHGPADSRIDMNHLESLLGNKIPIDPKDQNRVWYRLYREIENDPAIAQSHREFLFNRDYTAFAFLFLIAFGPASLWVTNISHLALAYFLFLLSQFLVVRHVAATYGVRFVTTVLARKASKLPRTPVKVKS